jgi:hypothetical protein
MPFSPAIINQNQAAAARPGKGKSPVLAILSPRVSV